MQHVKSRRVVVNPSGLWSLGLRFESGRDYIISLDSPILIGLLFTFLLQTHKIEIEIE